MKHRVYYDAGSGHAALLAAGIYLKLLPGDVLPDSSNVANFLRDHGNQSAVPGNVHLLGEARGELVYWCGLGKSTSVVIRTWRHFLHLYRQKQSEYAFCFVPMPGQRKWKKGEKLFVKGARERGRQLLSKAAVREYAVFLTVLMSEWQEG